MRRPKQKRQRRQGHGPIQFFDYGPWRFNINQALRLAGNRLKYQTQMQKPTPEWIGPFIDIDPSHVEKSDLDKSVILATVIQNGQIWKLLIDGHHRVVRALREQAMVPSITLDLEDTLKVLAAPSYLIEQMKRAGVELGLLSAAASS